MIRINLLPWREEQRQARRQQFAALAGLISVLAGLVWFLGYTIINGHISTQEGKNGFLKKEIAVLDKEIEEIKSLKEQIDLLLKRKQVIESLQANRAETVHLFNELARQIPEGVYLKGLKQTGQKVMLSGFTESNARVSTMMRNLEASPPLENPRLIEIKAVMAGNRRLSEFSLEVQITRQQANEEDRKKPAGPQPGGQKKP